MKGTWSWSVGVVFAMACVASAIGQDERRGPGTPDRPAPAARQDDRTGRPHDRAPGPPAGQPERGPEGGPMRGPLTEAGVRAMIERELERIARREAELKKALAALDEGAPVAEVSSRLRPLVREMVAPAPDDPRLAAIPAPAREELESFVRERMPRFWRRFQDARERAPAMARAFEERARPRLIELYRLHRADPELGALHIEEFQFGLEAAEAQRRFREARARGGPESAAAREAREALGAAIGEIFDTRERIHDLELARLEEQVQRIRQEHADRESRRRAFIEARVAEMLSGRGAAEERPDPGEDEGPGQ